MEEFFLSRFLTYNKLDIIDQQNIKLAVTVTEVGRRHVVLVSDGIDETIPGFVVGGPNSAPVDEKAEWLITPDTPPMKCFLDVWECYSLNEITIYWNSPAIFVAAFLDADIV